MSEGIKKTDRIDFLTENAETVLKRRYLKKDASGNVCESPEHMFRRVAAHIAEAEKNYDQNADIKKTEDLFYSLMAEFRFLPNSPTLMNAGRSLGQLAACFVLPVEDSIDGIFEAVKNAANIHKSGGGTGFSFSRLRPENSKVGSTGGVASGPVSFMKIFNTATEQIKQGGTRRGANMAVLRVDHPDIMTFIACKNNKKELNNFNISVGVTDKFMTAAAKNAEYDLIDPHLGRVTGRLNAAAVYNELVKQAWETGDPGIIFMDEINRFNTTPGIGEIESTNPCVTGDTFVMTSQGPYQVRELAGKQAELLVNGHPYTSAAQGFFSTGKKPVFTLQTKEGYQLCLTGDHKVRKAASIRRDQIDEEWCPADKLCPGDKIILHNHREYGEWAGSHIEAEGYLLGLLAGDGTLKEDKAILSVWKSPANGNDQAGPESIMKKALACAETHPHRSDFKGWQEIAGRNDYRLSLGAIKKLALELGMKPGNKALTPKLEQCSSLFYRGLLSGLFDADGSVQGDQNKGISVRLSQNDLPMLQTVQRMLLRLGIVSTIYKERRKAGKELLPDSRGDLREYPVKAQHELVISKENLFYFSERIGFRDETKTAKLDSLLLNYKRTPNRECFLATFDGLELKGEEEVFDVQVPGINAFDANGLYVHNCGEQPLLPMEACNLGSINLTRFITENNGKSEVDYEKLRETIRLSVRFLDNTIDMSKYPIDEIDRMVKGNRKIGLGIMGFADLLYMLGIPYDSEEALALAEKIMSFVQKESHKASCDLAETRGVFPNFDQSIFKDREDRRMRNATTTTIAPTGTLSIIAGCSSGIEPAFALSYVRTVMDNDRLIEVNPVFKRFAIEKDFYSDALMEEIAENGTVKGNLTVPPDLRKVFVTAHDIQPEHHIKMQAAFQKYTDNAVSKTVNLPHDATEADVRFIYDLAFQLKCKGVTIYRDGSKENQVLSVSGKEDKPDEDDFLSAGKARPKILEGFTEMIKTGMGNLYVSVSEYNNRPFEVFAIIGKCGKSTTAKTEAIGRLISLAFRSGIPVEEVVNQLKGISGEHAVFQEGGLVLSIPDAIAKVLQKRYLPDGNGNRKKKFRNGLKPDLCPECGQAITFEEGCKTCHSCGYTKCG